MEINLGARDEISAKLVPGLTRVTARLFEAMTRRPFAISPPPENRGSHLPIDAAAAIVTEGIVTAPPVSIRTVARPRWDGYGKYAFFSTRWGGIGLCSIEDFKIAKWPHNKCNMQMLTRSVDIPIG